MKKNGGSRKAGSANSGARRSNSGTAAKKKLNNINFLAVVTIILIVSLIGYMVYAANKQKDDTSGDYVNISFWFTNAMTNKWEKEVHKIPNGKQTEMLSQVLAEWSAGPRSEFLAKSIPSSVSIEDVKFDDVTKTVEVTFSEEYYNMSAVEGVVCNNSLVYTLTEFDFITDIHIYVGEAELVRANGQPVGILNRGNVVLDKPSEPDFDLKTITLYFADEQAIWLLPEEREVRVSPNQDLEKYIVEELIAGPKTTGHYSTISPDTKLRSVKTEEGLCYVDFTADFTKKFEGGSTAENLLVYSIVNSLTEIPSIKKVQILVEGDKISEAQGFNTDLSKPIERDEKKLQ